MEAVIVMSEYPQDSSFFVVAMVTALMHGCKIADVAISKRPLLFTVWTQLRLRSHQNFYEIFTHKQFLPTSAGNAQVQLHFYG